MRTEQFERKSTNVSETNRAFRTEMHERFRNESNSPRLHRIAVFPAETEVDNAWITLPFFYIFLTHDELSTGRRGNADLTISLSLSLSEREALRVIRLRQFSRESDQRRNQKKDELSPTSGKCRIGYVERFDRKRRVFFFFFLTGNFSNFPKFGPHGQIIAQVSEILQTLSSPPIETLFIPLVTISYRESFKRALTFRRIFFFLFPNKFCFLFFFFFFSFTSA